MRMGMGMGMGLATGTEDSRCSWDRRVCGSMQLVRIFPWRLLCATATSAAAKSTLTTSATGECRYQVLSAALCFFFFLFFCFFLERHILMMSRVESPCHRFTTNSDSELASISCGCCCNKGNANLCVSLWMLFLGLALNTLVYRVADRERGICFRSLGGMGKNSLRFLA